MEDTNKGGPKTEAGKAVTRLNAISHGLLSKEVLMDGEDGKILSRMTDALYEQMQPAGELESFLVDRMAAEMWRMRRAMAGERRHAVVAKERALNVMQLDELFGSSKGAKVAAADTALLVDSDTEKIMRYATAIERSFFRTLHELQRLQSARMGGLVAPPMVVEVNSDRLLGED